MTKTLPRTFALLLFLCASAHAAWEEIERFEDNTRVFADRRLTRRAGSIAETTHLVRWGETQSDPEQPEYRSTIVRTAYDCDRQRERYLSSAAYTGPMGDGRQVRTDDEAATDWLSISPGSMEEKLWRIACGDH